MFSVTWTIVCAKTEYIYFYFSQICFESVYQSKKRWCHFYIQLCTPLLLLLKQRISSSNIHQQFLRNHLIFFFINKKRQTYLRNFIYSGLKSIEFQTRMMKSCILYTWKQFKYCITLITIPSIFSASLLPIVFARTFSHQKAKIMTHLLADIL